MASFQQKLLLKGSFESIEYFTKVLKDVKDKAGLSTATAIIESLETFATIDAAATEAEIVSALLKLKYG